jgi:6-phosphogluconolactonase
MRSPSGRRVYNLDCPETVDIAAGGTKADIRLVRTRNFQVITTLPEDYVDGNTTAEIQFAPSGHFLYVSNRGHNSIAIFSVDQVNGKLSLIDWESTGGRTPRFFGLDPTGHLLYAANLDSDNIVVFTVDTATGKLTPTGQTVETGSPSCIIFARA